MTQQPLTLTIVIPAYNEEKYIGKTLESLKKQTHPPDEVIVANNNSTDKTAEIAQKAGAKVITEKKKGYVFAVHSGLSHATSEIVALTDSDTQLPPHWCERMREVFSDPKVVGVGGSISYKDAGTIGNVLTYPFYTLFMYFHFLIGKPHLTGSTMALRRSVLEKIGGVDTQFEVGADVDLGLRAKKFGKVVFDPSLTVVTSSRRWQKNRLKSLNKYIKAYLDAVWLHRSHSGSLEDMR